MRTTIRTILAVAAAGGAVSAWAETAVLEYQLDIHRKPLAAVLTELSEQTGLSVSYISKVGALGDIVVGPLTGRYTVESACNQIVAGTALKFVRVNDGSISIMEDPAHKVRLAQLAGGPEGASDTKVRARARAAGGSADESARYERGDLEEVIVTAQRRTQRLEDVPISITVLGGDDLDRSTAAGITEELRSVPGVATMVGVQNGGNQVAVRGVTASSALFSGSSPIGYYIDSVPFGLVKSAIAPESNAFDLERVEVLRGPQGTLYGASALNGVVRILTQDPNLDAFELKARTALSTTQDGGENYRGDMAVNVPIVEGKLAARAVLGYEDFSGWIDSADRQDINDSITRNMRLKVRAQPTDNLSIGLSAWVTRGDYGGPSTSDDNGRSFAALSEPMTNDYDAYGVVLGYRFADFTISSMTSYLEYENTGYLALGLPLALLTALDAKIVTEELVLNSTGEGAWRWSVGGIYRDGKDRTFQDLPGILPAPIAFSDATESFAAYGELTRVLGDGHFELTAGLRYFEDDVTATEGPNRTTSTFNATTPRVVLTWHPGDQFTAYASYAEGFRSGANQSPNVTTQAPSFPQLDADKLKNYELGAKGTLLDSRLTFDAAVYYIDWQDVQQTVTVNINTIPNIVLINGSSASDMGVDLAATAVLSEQFSFGINGSWNDLAMDQPVFSAGQLLFDHGDRLNQSAEYTFGALADYAFPIGQGGFEGRFTASANYVSEQGFRTVLGGNVVMGEGDAMLIARTSFSLDTPSRWSATLFVDNLTNEDGAFVRYGQFPHWDPRPRPRTMGLQLEYQF